MPMLREIQGLRKTRGRCKPQIHHGHFQAVLESAELVPQDRQALSGLITLLFVVENGTLEVVIIQL